MTNHPSYSSFTTAAMMTDCYGNSEEGEGTKKRRRRKRNLWERRSRMDGWSSFSLTLFPHYPDPASPLPPPANPCLTPTPEMTLPIPVYCSGIFSLVVFVFISNIVVLTLSHTIPNFSPSLSPKILNAFIENDNYNGNNRYRASVSPCPPLPSSSPLLFRKG